MAVHRRSARSRFTLALLVLTSVTLLTFDFKGDGDGLIGVLRDGARDALAPVQDTSDRLLAPVGDLVGGLIHYGDLEAENERLRKENEELRGAVLRADDADRERKALLAQLDLDFVDDIPRVDARVVSAARSNFDLSIELDKGTSDGIGVGMPVVTGSGLVGRVVDVSRSRATVLLVTDRSASVGVRLTESGDVGVAGGGGRGKPLTVDLIDPSTEVGVGEVVVTSGLQQSAYPPGIPVGLVASAESPPGALQQVVVLDPVVDLDRLSFVTVLQWGPR